MRKLVRYMVAGAVFGFGLAVASLLAANISVFTGPAGSNPINFPADMADVNTVINGVNSNAAFAGTGTPSQVIGTIFTNTPKLGTATTTILQIMNSAVWTTVTGATTCNVSSASWCLGIFDNNNTLRWLAGT